MIVSDILQSSGPSSLKYCNYWQMKNWRNKLKVTIKLKQSKHKVLCLGNNFRYTYIEWGEWNDSARTWTKKKGWSFDCTIMVIGSVTQQKRQIQF